MLWYIFSCVAPSGNLGFDIVVIVVDREGWVYTTKDHNLPKTSVWEVSFPECAALTQQTVIRKSRLDEFCMIGHLFLFRSLVVPSSNSLHNTDSSCLALPSKIMCWSCGLSLTSLCLASLVVSGSSWLVTLGQFYLLETPRVPAETRKLECWPWSLCIARHCHSSCVV